LRGGSEIEFIGRSGLHSTGEGFSRQRGHFGATGFFSGIEPRGRKPWREACKRASECFEVRHGSAFGLPDLFEPRQACFSSTAAQRDSRSTGSETFTSISTQAERDSKEGGAASAACSAGSDAVNAALWKK
jgi:hypothetical protein